MNHIVEETSEFITNADIHKIIDDAMTKKDRCISIFISSVGTTVKVDPIDESIPRWIDVTPEKTDDNNSFYIPKTYECSVCGARSRFDSPYCPVCGEKLKQALATV